MDMELQVLRFESRTEPRIESRARSDTSGVTHHSADSLGAPENSRNGFDAFVFKHGTRMLSTRNNNTCFDSLSISGLPKPNASNHKR